MTHRHRPPWSTHDHLRYIERQNEQTHALVLWLVKHTLKEDHRRHKMAANLGISFSRPELKPELVSSLLENHMPLEVSLTNEQRVLITVNPVTLAGRPAAIDGEPVFSVISGEGTVVETDPPDPRKRWLTSSDIPGDTVFLISADADLGAGVVEIADTVTMHVAGANAANLGLSLGTPEVKP